MGIYVVGTYVKRGTAPLYSHVVSPAKNLALGRHKAGPNRQPALTAACARLLQGCLEANVRRRHDVAVSVVEVREEFVCCA